MDLNAPATASAGKWKSTRTAAPSCESTGLASADTATSGASDDTISNQLTLFAADSPARTYRSPALAPDWTAPDPGSGGSTPELFARYDPATSSWKTSQPCLVEDWGPCLRTWPRAGMTRNGIAYQRRPLAPLTDAIASGLWPATAVKLWPTPCASEDNKSPEAHMAMKARMKGGPRHNDHQLECHGQGQGLWPTPTAVTNTGGLAMCKWGGSWSREKLRSMVTPAELNGALNPTWVEWLMGYPLEWTVLKDWATRSSRKSRNGSRTGSRTRTRR